MMDHSSTPLKPDHRKTACADNLEGDVDPPHCCRDDSHTLRKLMKKGVSPLAKLLEMFGDVLPIFDTKFLSDLDDFAQANPESAIDVVRVLMHGPSETLRSLQGVNIARYMVSALPNSLEMLVELCGKAGPDFSYSLLEMMSVESICALAQANAALASQLLFFVAHKVSLRDDELFKACCTLAENRNFETLDNVLGILEDRVDDHAVVPFVCSLFPLENCGLFCRALKVLSRHVVNGPSFNMVMEVIRRTLPTCNEQVIAAICGFFECVVSQDEMQDVIFDKDFLDIVIEWGSGCYPFHVKETAALLLCQIIKSPKRREDETVLASLPVAECILDLLETDTSNRVELLQGIEGFLHFFSDCEVPEPLVELLVNRQDLFEGMVSDSDRIACSSAKHILKMISSYSLL